MTDRPKLRTRLARVVSEFLVIVTGVLVALTADAWRQGRGERQAEAEYLNRLKADLEADTAALARTEAQLEAKDSVLARLAAGAGTEAYSPDDLARDLAVGTTWSWAFTPVRSVTFDEMRSTGRLGLIRDSDLRAAIASYYWAYQNVVATVEARQPTYNALTYRLVPRRTLGADSSSTLFDFEAGAIAGTHRRALASSEVLDEISLAATAERNLSRFSVVQATALRALATDLLDKLNNNEQ